MQLTFADGVTIPYTVSLSGLNLGANAAGSATATKNPDGEVSVVVRDGKGRTVRTFNGLGHQTTTRYDVVVSGLVEIAATDANNNTVRQRLDAAGDARQLVDALAKVTTQAFDADGNRVSVRDPVNVGMTCVYDAAQREITCTDTAGAVTSTAYDAHGNARTKVDARTKSEVFVYDARDRKIRSTDRVGAITHFAYDTGGNLLTMRDGDATHLGETQETTRYAYDERNLLTSEVFRDQRPTDSFGTDDSRVYTYDAARRLLTRVDQLNQTTTYVYDGSNRLTGRIYPDGRNDGFTYDRASRLLTATNARYHAHVTRTYDNAGRLLTDAQDINGTTYTVGHGYDNGDRVTSITYPDGKRTVRTYTARNELDLVKYGTSGSEAQVADHGYDNAGRLVTKAFANSRTETRTYTVNDRTVAIIVTPGVASFTYGYDPNKRKTGETDGVIAASSQTFAYDDGDRVTSWTRGGSAENQSWTLSKVGDWQSTSGTVNGSAISETRAHNPAHELTQVTVGGVNKTLSYDAKGNLTSDGTVNQTYAWDSENRLQRATIGSTTGTNAHYRYDALGRRVEKRVNGKETRFVHDGAQVVSEYEGQYLTRQDVGTVGIAGSITEGSTGITTLTGAGAGIAGTADGFSFAHRTLSGDGSMTVRLAGLTNATANGLAGVMIRAGTAANAPMAVVGLTPSGVPTFRARTVAGGAAATSTLTAVTLPQYLRITRTGTTLKGEVSANGSSWSQVGTATATLTGTISIGPVVTAGSTTQAASAALTNISTSGVVTRVTAATMARSYVYGSYVDEPLMMVSGSGTKYYFHQNHLYSVAAMTDSAGTVVERYKYGPYGCRTVLLPDGATAPSGSAYGNQVAWTGRYHDRETGLIYFRARQYSPVLGRFVGRDNSRLFAPEDLMATQSKLLEIYRRIQDIRVYKFHDMAVRYFGITYTEFISAYRDSASLYAGSFAPNGLDPTGRDCAQLSCAKGDTEEKRRFTMEVKGMTPSTAQGVALGKCHDRHNDAQCHGACFSAVGAWMTDIDLKKAGGQKIPIADLDIAYDCCVPCDYRCPTGETGTPVPPPKPK